MPLPFHLNRSDEWLIRKDKVKGMIYTSISSSKVHMSNEHREAKHALKAQVMYGAFFFFLWCPHVRTVWLISLCGYILFQI